MHDDSMSLSARQIHNTSLDITTGLRLVALRLPLFNGATSAPVYSTHNVRYEVAQGGFLVPDLFPFTVEKDAGFTNHA